MSTAYFDCFAGVSGNMFLGALIDLGLDEKALKSLLDSLGITHYTLRTEEISRKNIRAIHLSVTTHETKHHRTLPDILNIIDSPVLSEKSKNTIQKIFTAIAEAEGKIHRLPIEKIHFHEVGAVDAMIDVVGTVWGLEQLGITRCFSSAVSIGTGSVECAHGTIPVPAPATLEILKNYPVVKKEVRAELATPTGSAILTSVADYLPRLPPLRITGIGYGSGDRDLEEFPNILRIITGDPVSSYEEDTTLVAETNLDDMNTELFPFVMEKLFERGAVDVFLTPVIMKKGRPGYKITLLAPPDKLDNCVKTLFEETTTLGVRIQETGRLKLARSTIDVTTPWGTLKATSVLFNGKRHVVPEYEECRKVALREKIPLADVYDAVKRTGSEE